MKKSKDRKYVFSLYTSGFLILLSGCRIAFCKHSEQECKRKLLYFFHRIRIELRARKEKMTWNWERRFIN